MVYRDSVYRGRLKYRELLVYSNQLINSKVLTDKIRPIWFR